MTDSERIVRLEEIAEQHTAKLDEIGIDVKSLLQSRSYIRGAWKAIVVVSTTVSAIVGILLAVLRGR